jgi:large conductance mechanosensitive channel
MITIGAVVSSRPAEGKHTVANVLKGFKEFIARGNAVELAIGIVIGAAFGAVINSIVDNLITPLIAAIFGKPNLDSVLTFTINNANFSIGAVLTAVINFILVAAAIYFVVVMPLNAMQRRRRTEEVPADEKPEDIALLEQIRDLLAGRTPQA